MLFRSKTKMGLIDVGLVMLSISKIDTIPPTDDAAEVEANARLIAAAPELFKSLKDLLEQLDGIGIPDWAGAEGLCLTSARNAINKAEGKPCNLTYKDVSRNEKL